MESAAAPRGRNVSIATLQLGPMEELHGRGQRHYHNKRYKDAVLCFTRAIDRGITDLNTVLGSRSAAYAKLGNLRAALSDGQKMIKHDKTNVTGYLRTGKILTLMGKPDTARSLYEMGIGKVQAMDPDLVLLRRSYDKVVTQIDAEVVKQNSSTKRRDPFQILPWEIAAKILSTLTFPDVCYSINVSKSWMELLGSIPTLWTDLDFIAARMPVQEMAVRKYLRQGKGLPTRVTLPKSVNARYYLPRFITTRCKGLYELVVPSGLIGTTILQAVSCATNLKTLTIGSECQITGDTIEQLLEQCKALECVEFSDVTLLMGRPAQWKVDLPKLNSLVLAFTKTHRPGTTIQVVDLENLVKRIPNIRKLVIRSVWSLPIDGPGQAARTPDFSGLIHLEVLDISGMIASRPPKFPLSLSSLNISDIESPVLEFAPSQFTKLTRLMVGNSYHMMLNVRKMLEANKGKLTHFDATGGLFEMELEELITSGYFESVKELKLGMCDFNDDLAIILAKHVLSIKTLCLERTNITGVGVKALVIALKDKLEFLRLDECYKCSADANDWALATGVKTSFKFPDQRRGGRKVRQ